jgi:serine/threonine-protein kinase
MSETASFCGTCGAKATAGNRFCEQCGTLLDVGATAPTQAPRSPAPAAEAPAMIAHYRLGRVIAEGGMGVVYEALDERLGRTVALKLLREDLASDGEFRRRFIDESRAAASLDHPNILPVFDADEADGVLYIATRLVAGQDLRRLIAREGRLGIDRAVRIAAQLAAALDHAHAKGIVHRDVKPGNVLIVPADRDEHEHAYLIDFGIVKRADAQGPDVTAIGRFVGTPEYAAPEQILGEPMTGRVDQYALAGVLFHCLTGASPYADISSATVMQAHLTAPVPHLLAERPDAPSALDAALMRAMDKDPSRRFASCRAFLDATRATASETAFDALRVVPDPVSSSVPVDASPSTGRRALVVAGVLLAAAALAGGGALAATKLSDKGEDPAATHAPTTRPDTAAQTTPTETTATTTTTAETGPETTPAETTPTVPSVGPLDVDALSFAEHAMDGYTAQLPRNWKVGKDDEPQTTSGDVTRRRTTVADRARPISVVIDHLTHFDVPPEENRATLQKSYISDVPGYRFVSDDDYDLDGREVYEWRYEVAGPSGGRVQRVDLMFRDGADDFAVLATGRADYDVLARLAQAVARTVTVTAPAEPEPARVRDERLPENGTYTGTGTQHLSSGDNRGVALIMRFGHGSTVEYPRLGCTARLLPVGFDGDLRVYRERFTTSGCDDPGTWKVHKLSLSALSASWSASGDNYTVTAELTR